MSSEAGVAATDPEPEVSEAAYWCPEHLQACPTTGSPATGGTPRAIPGSTTRVTTRTAGTRSRTPAATTRRRTRTATPTPTAATPRGRRGRGAAAADRPRRRHHRAAGQALNEIDRELQDQLAELARARGSGEDPAAIEARIRELEAERPDAPAGPDTPDRQQAAEETPDAAAAAPDVEFAGTREAPPEDDTDEQDTSAETESSSEDQEPEPEPEPAAETESSASSSSDEESSGDSDGGDGGDSLLP